jgi:gluconolactonase
MKLLGIIAESTAIVTTSFLFVLAGMAASNAWAQTAQRKTIGSVESLDPTFDKLVPKDAKLEIVVDGLDWCEGPLWIPAGGGFAIVSDIPPNIIHRWDPRGGKQTYLSPSGYTGTKPRGGEQGVNGSTLDLQKRLVLCQHGDRRLARMEAPLDKPESKFVTVADRYEGKRFNSPNDVALHSSGALYFTDPPYGMEGYDDDLSKIPNKELDFQGVFRVAPDGKVTLLTKELDRPNGIAFSPDEKTLYVANSFSPKPIIMAYPVKEDGTIGAGRVFFNAAPLIKTPNDNNPDGMEVDTQGNVYLGGPGGVVVISPQGKHLGSLHTGEKTSNVAFGEDGSTLYVTADSYLLRVRLTAKGRGF